MSDQGTKTAPLVSETEAHGSDSEQQPPKSSWTRAVINFLSTRHAFRTAAVVLAILTIPLSLVVGWYVWFRWLPSLWHWGFTGLSWRAIPASVAVLFVAGLPVAVVVWAAQVTLVLLRLYDEAEATQVKKSLEQGSSELEKVENELKDGDKDGLVLLLRYSRVQLNAYYWIGLTQTQKSFRYGIIAMWAGFSVVLAGIIVRVVDLKKLGLLPPENSVTTLVILAGVIIEVVSALFLWVYRKSVKQLTYFYDRQMYNHTVLMCHRIAGTMHSSDDVKKQIVQKVLDKPWVLDQDALPQGSSLLSFGAKQSAAASPTQ